MAVPSPEGGRGGEGSTAAVLRSAVLAPVGTVPGSRGPLTPTAAGYPSPAGLGQAVENGAGVEREGSRQNSAQIVQHRLYAACVSACRSSGTNTRWTRGGRRTWPST